MGGEGAGEKTAEKDVVKPGADTEGATAKFAEEVQAERATKVAMAGEKDAKAEAGDKKKDEAGDKKVELKEGVVKNADGSEVESKKCADGQVHPVRTKFANGYQVEFEYDKDGNVSQFTNRRPDGTVRDRWQMDAKEGVFKEERSGAVQDLKIKVRADGTALGTDKNGNTIESKLDGSVIYRFKDGQGTEHKVQSFADGSSLEYNKFSDGKERITAVRFPDGREAHYGYMRNGSVADVTEWTPGGPNGGGRIMSKYSSQDGIHWADERGKGPSLTGKLELKADGNHVFTDSSGTPADGTTWTRNHDGSTVYKDRNGNIIQQTPAIKIPGR